MVRLALGPSSESRQGTNPRVGGSIQQRWVPQPSSPPHSICLEVRLLTPPDPHGGTPALSPYLNLNLRRCHELRPARSALPRKRVRSLTPSRRPVLVLPIWRSGLPFLPSLHSRCPAALLRSTSSTVAWQEIDARFVCPNAPAPYATSWFGQAM